MHKQFSILLISLLFTISVAINSEELIGSNINEKLTDGPIIDENQSIEQLKISRIIIDGNNRTKDKWILAKTDFKEGDIYDSLKIPEAEEKLRDSRLFTLVKIYPIKAVDHVTILITVRERRYFKITDYSGAMYSKKWGQPSKTFLQAYGAFKLENFRGMDEELKIDLSFWTIRYLGISWKKPFLKYPYFMTIGSRIGSQPSIVSPWNLDFYNISWLGVGRKFGKHSSLSLNIDGRYKKQTVKSKGQRIIHTNSDDKELFFSFLDSLDYLSNEIDDTTWTYTYASSDSSDSSYYIWNGNNSERVKHLQKAYEESFLSLRWITDKRDNYYNPKKGFLIAATISTNFLWPYIDDFDGIKFIHRLDTTALNTNDAIFKDTVIWSAESRNSSTYLRLRTDFRLYHRGIWKNSTVAYRFQPTITPLGKNNIYSGLYMGDIGSLRGYGSGYFGNWLYNNRLLFSLEYRFKLFNMPDLKFPFLAWYDKGMANLSTRFDGALIFDYGRIWADISNPIHDAIEAKQAMGVGLGIRVISPNVKRSLCFDVVWGLPAADQSKKGKPAWYLYIDLPY